MEVKLGDATVRCCRCFGKAEVADSAWARPPSTPRTSDEGRRKQLRRELPETKWSELLTQAYRSRSDKDSENCVSKQQKGERSRNSQRRSFRTRNSEIPTAIRTRCSGRYNDRRLHPAGV